MSEWHGDAQRLTQKQQITLALNLKRKMKGGLEVTDEHFDLLFSPDVRQFSHFHWTPMQVALKASEILSDLKVERLLDVGSGCGKFCAITAILGEIQVTGVEQREFLNSAAKKIRNYFQLSNLNFVHGSAFDMSWKEFDCIYFFNPFCEQKTPERHIRNDVPLSESLYHTFVQLTLSRLREQKKGSRVMTFHGMGGVLPDSYQLSYQKAIGADFLKVWIKSID